MWSVHKVQRQTSLIYILPPPLINCTALGKLLNLSVLQFPHLLNGIIVALTAVSC